MTHQERQQVLRHNRRRLFLNRLIERKRAIVAKIRTATRSHGAASMGGF
tara:strand:- start:1273 stop:1419 length:147 start_codon:yes stop_codon:yes gene_type:complete